MNKKKEEELEQGELLEVKPILPEALASLNVRFSFQGFEYLLTIRAVDGYDGIKAASNLIANLRSITKGLYQKGANPIYGRNAKKPEAKAEQPPEPSEREHWCEEHGVEFRKWEKEGRSWYSHKIEGTEDWCNEPKKKE